MALVYSSSRVRPVRIHHRWLEFGSFAVIVESDLSHTPLYFPPFTGNPVCARGPTGSFQSSHRLSVREQMRQRLPTRFLIHRKRGVPVQPINVTDDRLVLSPSRQFSYSLPHLLTILPSLITIFPHLQSHFSLTSVSLQSHFGLTSVSLWLSHPSVLFPALLPAYFSHRTSPVAPIDHVSSPETRCVAQ